MPVKSVSSYVAMPNWFLVRTRWISDRRINPNALLLIWKSVRKWGCRFGAAKKGYVKKCTKP